jgi:di/tricarboxylate transporter
MTWEAWVTLGLVALVFASLTRNWAPPDATFLAASVIAGLLGIITPGEAFSGFINEGVITIGALFVVAAALRETGALDTVGEHVLGRARTDRQAMLRFAGPVAAMSAFMNNTPIVAMMMPMITSWCRRMQVSPSRLLIPLSYFSVLGGTCTLIGTSTHLVVNGLMVERDMVPLGFFELSYIGLPFVALGTVYLFAFGHRLLPDRKDLIEQLGESSREYLVDMRIEPGCRLIGQRVGEAGLRRLPGLFLIELTRGEEVTYPVAPDQLIEDGDVLTFTGVVSTIVDLERIPGLVPVADEGYEARAAERRSQSLCEAVISSQSPLTGQNIREANFRAVYNAAVIAVHRAGRRVRGRVGDIVLRSGDTLLLQAGPHFAQAHRNNPDFYLVSGVEESRPVRHDKAILSMVLLAALVGLMTTGYVPKVMAALLIAGVMVVLRCISASVARQSVDWQTLFTIGAAFGLGKAIENTGLADLAANVVVQAAGQLGPHGVLAVTYILTIAFAESITNKAAVVLMFPLAIAIAAQLDLQPKPFIMAITFAAASSMVTPLGYQTNLMVYGPGGYRYTDFVRVGLPLTVALFVCATLLIPVFWSF